MKEALKLALEALEAIYTVGDVACVVKPEGEIYLKPVIDKCKEALAQLEIDPWREAVAQPERDPWREAAAQPDQVSEYECLKLLYGFMLDCNAVGLEQAGKNLHRGIKEKTA